MADIVERLRAAAKFGGHYADAADEIERLGAIVTNLGRPHVCGGAIKPGGESCTRCGAEEAAAELRSLIAPGESDG